jgi:hypothetical protein
MRGEPLERRAEEPRCGARRHHTGVRSRRLDRLKKNLKCMNKKILKHNQTEGVKSSSLEQLTPLPIDTRVRFSEPNVPCMHMTHLAGGPFSAGFF